MSLTCHLFFKEEIKLWLKSINTASKAKKQTQHYFETADENKVGKHGCKRNWKIWLESSYRSILLSHIAGLAVSVKSSSLLIWFSITRCARRLTFYIIISYLSGASGMIIFIKNLIFYNAIQAIKINDPLYHALFYFYFILVFSTLGLFLIKQLIHSRLLDMR